jgi:cytochrome c oxidase subunit 4
MSDDHAAHVDAHVRTALVVFGALLVLTGATVAAWAWLDLSVPMTITLALLIALVKGSLVACWFMHLISEKKLIFMVLILTVAFFFVLMLVPVLTSISDQTSSAGPLPTPAAATEEHSGH